MYHNVDNMLVTIQVGLTNDSKFNRHGTRAKQYVWHKPNTEFLLNNTQAIFKHGGTSVLVGGCVFSARIGYVHYIDS